MNLKKVERLARRIPRKTLKRIVEAQEEDVHRRCSGQYDDSDRPIKGKEKTPKK